MTRRLWLLSLFSIAAIILTSTHDGGAQWGPRFFLVATPGLLLLAASAAANATGAGVARRMRVALVIVVFLAGLWTTQAAYRELRGSKRSYSTVVAALDATTSPGDYIIFNVWWFDQIVASLGDSRTFLYAPNPSAAGDILRELAHANISRATLAWTREREGEPLDGAVVDTCFRIDHLQSCRARADVCPRDVRVALTRRTTLYQPTRTSRYRTNAVRRIRRPSCCVLVGMPAARRDRPISSAALRCSRTSP
jgi:hypothetical protein